MNNHDREDVAGFCVVFGAVAVALVLVTIFAHFLGFWWGICAIMGPCGLAALIWGIRYLWRLQD